MVRQQRGFTLIELLIVVAIIGIIAAIAIPNMLAAVDRGKQKATMGNLRAIMTALEEYSVDTGYYPMYTNYAALSAGISPSYIRRMPAVDGWGRPFVYEPDGASGALYTVKSLGKDGMAESSPAGGPTTTFNNDIIASAGAFTQYPQGTQQ